MVYSECVAFHYLNNYFIKPCMDSLSNQITLIIIASVFFIIVAIGIILLILVYQKKQLQYLNDKGLMRMNFDKELFETQLEIQEQTLKNISQEIHDNIGQGLSLAKLNINTMDSNGVAVLQDKINASKHLITKAIQDLRDLSKSLKHRLCYGPWACAIRGI